MGVSGISHGGGGAVPASGRDPAQGLERQLRQIEEQMKRVKDNDRLSPEEKQKKLEALQRKKAELEARLRQFRRPEALEEAEGPKEAETRGDGFEKSCTATAGTYGPAIP